MISKKVSAHIYSKNPEDPVDVIASDYVIEKKGLLKDEESCEKASTNPFLQAKLKYMLN